LLHAVANRVVLLTVLLLAPACALAAGNAALEACTRLTEDSARLACFDREVPAMIAREHPTPRGSAASAGAPASASAAPGGVAPAGQPLTDEQKMGLTPGRIQQLERPADAPPPPATMTIAIQSLSSDGNGHQVFVLENGQVWRQVEMDTQFRVKEGDSVTISRGVSGSYFMSFGKHRNTRVSRVR
jgi:hypothetical protein